MKRSLSRAASAVGAAIILSTVGFAGPAQATEACWSGPGSTCRDYRESAAGLAKVRASVQPTFTGILKAGQTLTSSPGLWVFGQGTETKAAGVLIAAGLVWVIRPLRASVARIVGRKAP